MLKLSDNLYDDLKLEVIAEQNGMLSIRDMEVFESESKPQMYSGWYILTKEDAIKLRDYLNENYLEE